MLPPYAQNRTQHFTFVINSGTLERRSGFKNFQNTVIKTTASNVPIVAIDVTTSLSLTGNRDWVLCIEYEVFI